VFNFRTKLNFSVQTQHFGPRALSRVFQSIQEDPDSPPRLSLASCSCILLRLNEIHFGNRHGGRAQRVRRNVRLRGVGDGAPEADGGPCSPTYSSKLCIDVDVSGRSTLTGSTTVCLGGGVADTCEQFAKGLKANSRFLSFTSRSMESTFPWG
jgi:hypothetical protein